MLNTVLLIEDNLALVETLSLSLQMDGYKVIHFGTGTSALQSLPSLDCDIALLDIELPEMNGFELLQRIRVLKPTLPVIFLTARSSEDDVVRGLELGADDYIRKPFSNKELLARLRVALRSEQKGQSVEYLGLMLDPGKLILKWASTSMELRRREFEILERLVRKQGSIASREELLSAGERGRDVYDRTIDSHISHLRNRLAKLTEGKIKLVAVYGMGYRIELAGS